MISITLSKNLIRKKFVDNRDSTKFKKNNTIKAPRLTNCE